MALAGIAYSCMVVSSFSRAQVRVLQLGFADDINTYVMISGMINYYLVYLVHICVYFDFTWVGNRYVRRPIHNTLYKYLVWLFQVFGYQHFRWEILSDLQ